MTNPSKANTPLAPKLQHIETKVGFAFKSLPAN